jgi:hypothetical protein
MTGNEHFYRGFSKHLYSEVWFQRNDFWIVLYKNISFCYFRTEMHGCHIQLLFLVAGFVQHVELHPLHYIACDSHVFCLVNMTGNEHFYRGFSKHLYSEVWFQPVI